MTLHAGVLFSLLALITLLFVIHKKFVPTRLFLPLSAQYALFKEKSLKVYLQKLVPYCFWLSLVAIAISFSEPKARQKLEGVQTEKAPIARSGNALYFVIDQSGSMAEKVVSGLNKEAKLTVAKDAVNQFLSQDSNDLVGLVAFARAARTISPLTLDRSQVQAELQTLTPITDPKFNGTALGYAIFKTVHTIVATKYFAERQKKEGKAAFSIENQAIVVITDGLQAPHPEDQMHPFRYIPVQEALRYASQNAIKVYFIGVDPIFRTHAAQAEVQELQAQITKTGGKLFLMSPEQPLSDIFSALSSLEKSPLKRDEVLYDVYSYKTLSAYFVASALFFLFLAILIETLFAKRVP
jgi:Ca-activated chloride channel homolog